MSGPPFIFPLPRPLSFGPFRASTFLSGSIKRGLLRGRPLSAPWFKGTAEVGWTQWVGTKKVHTAYTPHLGYYDNRTPATLSKHVEWATAYGIDAFMIEWWGLLGGKFRAGIDDVVRPFLANPDFKKIKFFFVYSFIQALRKEGEPTFPIINLDDAERVNKLVSDYKYVARTYFNQPNQLRINGRPVTYLWAIASTKGNFKAAMTKLRNAVKSACGSDPYIIGDELFFRCTPDLVRTPYLDAVMPYMMIKGGTPIRNCKLEATIDDIIAQYRGARLVCADLGVKFIPLGFAGFNAVGAPWCYDDKRKLITPVVARSVSGFKSFVQKAKEAIDPELRLFYITSWSEWNEGTNAARAYMGIGFSGNETGWEGANNYCWAGDRYKYATLHLDLPAGAAARKPSPS